MTRRSGQLAHCQRLLRLCRSAWRFSVVAIGWGLLAGVSLVAADDEELQRRELLSRSTPRYRRLKESLAAVEQLQSVGRAAESLKTVQWILDQPSDAGCVRTEHGGRRRGKAGPSLPPRPR